MFSGVAIGVAVESGTAIVATVGVGDGAAATGAEEFEFAADVDRKSRAATPKTPRVPITSTANAAGISHKYLRDDEGGFSAGTARGVETRSETRSTAGGAETC